MSKINWIGWHGTLKFNLLAISFSNQNKMSKINWIGWHGTLKFNLLAISFFNQKKMSKTTNIVLTLKHAKALS